jgi:DNA modification methylase
MVEVFREVKRILRDDGTCWLNLGSSYAASGGDRVNGSQGLTSVVGHTSPESNPDKRIRPAQYGFKPKDMVPIPWMVALALQQDGWYLRQDIIWHKPNPMPESVKDRCTKAHEYIFLLTKRAKYYYNADAIKEPASTTGNKRSVWTVPTKPYSEAHFATFPPALILPCILAGCHKGGIVLDPFMGSGTVAEVAAKNQRDYVGCELNPEYMTLNGERASAANTGVPVKEARAGQKGLWE